MGARFREPREEEQRSGETAPEQKGSSVGGVTGNPEGRIKGKRGENEQGDNYLLKGQK